MILSKRDLLPSGCAASPASAPERAGVIAVSAPAGGRHRRAAGETSGNSSRLSSRASPRSATPGWRPTGPSTVGEAEADGLICGVHRTGAFYAGMAPARLQTLLDVCKTPLTAPSRRRLRFWEPCRVFPVPPRQRLRGARAEGGEEILRRTEALGARVLTPFDPLFPAALHDIPDAPALLFLSGDRPCSSGPPSRSSEAATTHPMARRSAGWSRRARPRPASSW